MEIKDSPHGGDYDCLGNLNNHLVHIEIKAGKIQNLSSKDFFNFYNRHRFLAPELSIFFVDYNNKHDHDIIKTIVSPVSREIETDLFYINFNGCDIYRISPVIYFISLAQNGNISKNLRAVLNYNAREKDSRKKLGSTTSIKVLIEDIWGVENTKRL